MAEAFRDPPTSTNLQRDVMRRAWSLHRIDGSSFANALRVAWRHQKAQTVLDAMNTLRGNLLNIPEIAAEQNKSCCSFLLDKGCCLSFFGRNLIAETIERLVEVLDLFDGDFDREIEIDEPDPDFETDDRNLKAISKL